MSTPCPNCGQVNPASNAFCGRCGAQLAQASNMPPPLTPERRAAQWGWGKQASSNQGLKGCLIAAGAIVVLLVICSVAGRRDRADVGGTGVVPLSPPSGTASANSGGAGTRPAPAAPSYQSDRERFMAAVRNIDKNGTFVTGAGEGVTSDVLRITVSNNWHYEPYQVRYQMAQSLWSLWANIHTPGQPDKSRISIRDQNGNEVGGSRVLAGSLIWVQEE